MKNLGTKLSIVIVNYNAGDFLLACLNSVQTAGEEIDLSVWVVDNDSLDSSLEEAKKRFPEFNYIKNTENIGYGAANNIALKKVNTEDILLLNPDTTVKASTLQYMLDYMKDNPDVGAASCKVEKSDGSIDWASHRGFPTPWASFLYFVFKNDSLYHLRKADMTRSHEVDSISGAFFLTRKSVLEKVGLFDEDYFLYAEDIDLCYRIKQAGFKVMYVPVVQVFHYKGISSGIKKHSHEISAYTITSRKKALDSFYQTMKIFYKKHLAKKYPFFINWLVYFGISLRWLISKRKMHV